jgi:pilus assembly protein CpaB
MKPKSIALLLLALGCGLVASIGITEVMRRNATASAAGETQPLLLAVTDIGLGDQLTPQAVKLEEWPKDKVPVGALARLEDAEGRRARTKLYAGEPIMETKLLSKGASAQGASALIPAGYRVVPVKVDLESGGGSLILPGDRVDVMIHVVRDPSREIPETVTKSILQDIKVFAVDDVVDLEKEKENRKSIVAKTISLLVTPDQAAKLMLASRMGSINLVMRPPDDDKMAPNTSAKPGDLFGSSVRADRGKESLMEPPAPDLAGKTKGMLDFLNSIKGKPVEKALPAADPPTPRDQWTMRLLKPGAIDEVTFELDETRTALASPLGLWKTTAAANGAGGVRPAKLPSKLPAAQSPAAGPTDAAPPLPEPNAAKPDKP